MFRRDVSQSAENVLDHPGKSLQDGVVAYLNEVGRRQDKPRGDRLGVISFDDTAVIDALPTAESDHLHALSPGVTWGGWLVPVWLEIVVLATFGLVALVAGAIQFNRTD